MTFVIDEMHNKTRADFGDLPNCCYLIGKDGRVFYKQAWTNASTLEPAIEKLLAMKGKGGEQPPTFDSGPVVSSKFFGVTASGRRLLRIPQIYRELGLPVERGKEKDIAWLGSLDEAKRVANEKGAPAFVEFFLPGCSFCHQMATEVLVEPKVVELSRRIACVKLNVKDEAVSKIFDELGFAGTPSMAFYLPDGKLLLKHESILDTEELLALMYTSLEKTKK